MPRLTPDQFSLLEPAYATVSETKGWPTFTKKKQARRLKDKVLDSFRGRRPLEHIADFEAYDDSWWESAIYALALPKRQATRR